MTVRSPFQPQYDTLMLLKTEKETALANARADIASIQHRALELEEQILGLDAAIELVVATDPTVGPVPPLPAWAQGDPTPPSAEPFKLVQDWDGTPPVNPADVAAPVVGLDREIPTFGADGPIHGDPIRWGPGEPTPAQQDALDALAANPGPHDVDTYTAGVGQAPTPTWQADAWHCSRPASPDTPGDASPPVPPPAPAPSSPDAGQAAPAPVDTSPAATEGAAHGPVLDGAAVAGGEPGPAGPAVVAGGASAPAPVSPLPSYEAWKAAMRAAGTVQDLEIPAYLRERQKYELGQAAAGFPAPDGLTTLVAVLQDQEADPAGPEVPADLPVKSEPADATPAPAADTLGGPPPAVVDPAADGPSLTPAPAAAADGTL